MSSSVLSFLAWSFVPNFATSNLHSLYYSLTIRAGEPKPQPGSATFARHRRRIYAFVILTYLCYTLYEADWQIRRDGSFYTMLEVPLDADERTIQSRFRKLTMMFHPDKLPAAIQNDPAARAAADRHYVTLQIARDTLVDPVKRFAYDRFGSEAITEWNLGAAAKSADAETLQVPAMRDFVLRGAQNLAGYYIGTGIVLGILRLLGVADWGSFWRALAVCGLLVGELSTITSRSSPWPVTRILNPALTAVTAGSHPLYLPFQAIVLARRALITLFIAFSHLGPLLDQALAAADPSAVVVDSPQHTEQQLAALEQISQVTLAESQRQLALELVPFRDAPAQSSEADGEAVQVDAVSSAAATSGGSLASLRARLREWLVNNAVRNEQEVRDAVGRVVAQRRREGVPFGARGTR